MARDEQRAEASRKRERLTALLLALFPLLAATGFFAPGFVSLFAVAQEQEPVARESVVDRVGPYAHRPLMVPRDFSAGFIPELLDLDQLFVNSTFRLDPSGEQIARISAFDRSYGDSITRDSVGELVMDIVFKDALMVEEPKVVAAAFDPPGTNGGLCGTLHAGNCFRDDDLTSVGVVVAIPVPEPGAAAMLALGLFGLAFCARRY